MCLHLKSNILLTELCASNVVEDVQVNHVTHVIMFVLRLIFSYADVPLAYMARRTDRNSRPNALYVSMYSRVSMNSLLILVV